MGHLCEIGLAFAKHLFSTMSLKKLYFFGLKPTMRRACACFIAALSDCLGYPEKELAFRHVDAHFSLALQKAPCLALSLPSQLLGEKNKSFLNDSFQHKVAASINGLQLFLSVLV